jgi:hypothetical protein
VPVVANEVNGANVENVENVEKVARDEAAPAAGSDRTML